MKQSQYKLKRKCANKNNLSIYLSNSIYIYNIYTRISQFWKKGMLQLEKYVKVTLRHIY